MKIETKGIDKVRFKQLVECMSPEHFEQVLDNLDGSVNQTRDWTGDQRELWDLIRMADLYLFSFEPETTGYRVTGQGAGGTSLKGYLDISYQDLVMKFGEPPCVGDGYKVDAEWVLQFDDGDVATIYNYKDGKNYNGTSGTPVEEITHWHIGGKSPNIVDRVMKIVNS